MYHTQASFNELNVDEFSNYTGGDRPEIALEDLSLHRVSYVLSQLTAGARFLDQGVGDLGLVPDIYLRFGGGAYQESDVSSVITSLGTSFDYIDNSFGHLILLSLESGKLAGELIQVFEFSVNRGEANIGDFIHLF